MLEALARSTQRLSRLETPDVVVNLSEGVADAFRLCTLGYVLLHPVWRTFRDVEHRAIAQGRGELLHRLGERTIRQPRRRLVRADLAADIVQDVTVVERIERAHAEIDAELQAGLTRRRVDPVVLLEKKDAESVEPRVLDAEPVFRFVHPEAARPA